MKLSKVAARQDDIEDLKTGIKAYSDDLSPEAKEKLIARMRTAIAMLSPSDQVILCFWLEDKSTYVARSAEALGTSESYIAVRRHRMHSGRQLYDSHLSALRHRRNYRRDFRNSYPKRRS